MIHTHASSGRVSLAEKAPSESAISSVYVSR